MTKTYHATIGGQSREVIAPASAVTELPSPKMPRPRFALQGHEWLPSNYRNLDEIIRSHGEWTLRKRIRGVPTAAETKKKIQQPDQGLAEFEKKFPSPKGFERLLVASDFIRQLAVLVQRGLAEKQERKDSRGSKREWAKNQPRVTAKEIQDAVGSLYHLASLATIGLMDISKSNPELVQPLARQKESWPLMMSVGPGYKVKHIQFLNQLQQGKDAVYDIHPTSRDGTQRKSVEKGTPEIAKQLYVCLLVEWRNTGKKLDGKSIEEFCDDAKISSAWWTIAQARLLEAYPAPHEIEELRRIAAPSRKYPSQIQEDVLRRLKAAFLGLAKNQKELKNLAPKKNLKSPS